MGNDRLRCHGQDTRAVLSGGVDMGIRLFLKDALQRMPSRVLLALLATSAFASVWIASSGAVSAREAKAGAVAKAGPIGVLARAMALNLTVHMHLVGRPGHLL